MIAIGGYKTKLMLSSGRIKKAYLGDVLHYSSSNPVTYIVDTSVQHVEQVEYGASCLSPKTFTPQKSGYVFVGWREDDKANSSVLQSKLMGSSPITLYAVFKKTITLSYNGNGATSGSTAAQSDNQYYNNGNTANPTFTISANGFTRSYYNFANWRMGSTSGTQYAPGAKVTLSASTVMYAMWTARVVSKTVTKSARTAINNWASVRTLVEFGVVFASNPWVGISGDNEQRVVLTQKTYAIVTSSHQQGGGEWDVTVTAKGNAYESSAASGIATSKGEFEAVIDNWQGGTKYISFSRTYKSKPTVNWYSPNPSRDALAEDWTINITNVTTTGFTISWGANTGGARHQLGWIAEGPV